MKDLTFDTVVAASEEPFGMWLRRTRAAAAAVITLACAAIPIRSLSSSMRKVRQAHLSRPVAGTGAAAFLAVAGRPRRVAIRGQIDRIPRRAIFTAAAPGRALLMRGAHALPAGHRPGQAC